jgi:hypothetical protein
MCSGAAYRGEPATPKPAAAPTPPAAATFVDPNPSDTEDLRRKKLDSLRMGMLSTIKTSPTGINPASALVFSPVATALKAKLGA